MVITLDMFPFMKKTKDTHVYEDTNNLEPSKNVYVCITGQLSRLELRNKMDKLFLPLHNRGYKLFIGLALTTEPARYVNKDNGDKMRLYTTIHEVQKTLLNVSGVVEVKYLSTVNNLGDVYVNTFYQQSLGYVNTTARVKLNARQYRALQHCNQPKISNHSSFFIRLREDTFIDRIHLDSIINMAQGGAVVTTECDAWWGVNDKMAFGPSPRASDFFLAPFEYYLSLQKLIDNLNPEQLYKKSYEDKGFTLVSTPEFIVTKAVTTIKREKKSASEHPAGDSDSKQQQQQPVLCSVKGNSFQKWAKKCPPSREISSNTSYSALCYPPQKKKMLV